MYIPESFRPADQAAALSFIEHYDFATLITVANTGEMLVTHLPLFLQRSGDHPVLIGHVARANEHWRHFDGLTKSLAIFHGPHGYVSPNWYETAPAVPTWNYAVVHAHGCPVPAGDRYRTAGILEQLVEKHEGRRSNPWNLRGLSPEYRDHMMEQIVGFEMQIDRIESKFKLGQNRSKADREGTVKGLLQDGTPESAALAAFMQQYARV